MNEFTIIQAAIEALRKQTGLQADWLHINNQPNDGQLVLHTAMGMVEFMVEMKKEIREYQLPDLMRQARDTNLPLIVVAEKIFPKIKEQLRQQNIAYLDTAGNIFVNNGQFYIWIDGNKTPEAPKPVTNRAFTKTGLKTVFYFLVQQQAINEPYRTIAEKTGVALGNVKNVIEGLKDAGYILRVNDSRVQLKNKKELLDRWVEGYRETLQPTLVLGVYKFMDSDKFFHWKDLYFNNQTSTWGGEPAGELLTNYLVPEILTVYTLAPTELMKDWRLIPDPAGKVRLCKKFWHDDRLDEQYHTPALLVYADLMATGDPRCVETAIMIYDKYLTDEFK